MNKREQFFRMGSRSSVNGAALMLVALTGAMISSPTFAQASQSQPPLGAPITGAIRARDLVVVQISGEATLSGQHIVAADGKITLPLAGTIKIAGMTSDKAAASVAELYKRKNLLRNPQVVVTIAGRPERTVFISGALEKQGRIILLEGTRLSEVLEPAGVSAAADLSKVVITRGEKQVTVNYLAYRTGGDAPEGPNNPLLEDGDKVYVRARVQVAGTIKVNGEVKTPQVTNLVDTVTAFQAIQLAGGVTDLADRSRIYVLRDGMEIPVPYKEIQGGNKEKDITLKDKDEIFVRRAGSVKITGEVRTPQLLPLTETYTVLQAIQFSGGVTELADNNKIVVMRNGSELTIPYKDIQQGAKEKDLVLQDKDEIFVRKLEKPKTYIVTGGIARNGPYPVLANTTLSEAIAAAGGPMDRVDLKKVTVQRKTSTGNIETKTYNMTVAADQATPIQVDDIITLPYPKQPKQNILNSIGSIASLLFLFRR